MKCKKPTIFNKRSGIPSPCGQCQHCRINKRRTWTHRIVLEANQNSDNSFLTLTYDDDHLPSSFHHKKTGEIYASNSVNPYHFKAFIDNLNHQYRSKTGHSLRYFGVGEYGDKSSRPHYHIALFGFPSCPYYREGVRYKPCVCSLCTWIKGIWKFGNILNANLSKDSAQYIAGYTIKKLTSNKSEWNQRILAGRHPEFSRMSRNPGIAYQAVVDIFSHLTKYGKNTYLDIPKYLSHGKTKLPLGRYMLDKLAEFTIDGKEIDKVSLYKTSLRDLFCVSEIPLVKAHGLFGDASKALEIMNEQYSRNLESKTQLFIKEKTI